jgi:CheY-like chemotaxis protein
MYDILIVDDDLFALAILEEQLKSYGDFFTPVYASNGKEAVEILSQEDISLLVTDLIMPGDVSGWDLVEYVENFYPHIPVVVITGCTDKEKIEALHRKVRQILIKPIKVTQLVTIVTNILNEDITSGSLKGISVGSFLQLLEIDRRTCLLEVGNSPKNKGLLYVNRGKLYDAEYGELRELDAARRLIAMDNVRFQIKALPKVEIRRRIKADLMSIIMDAMKQKDEAATALEPRRRNILPSQDDIIVTPAAPEQPKLEADKRQPAVPPSSTTEKDNMIELEKIFSGLHSIKGYRAAALMNFSGEILIADAVDPAVELDNIGPIFNDVLRSSEEASEKLGIEPCLEFALKTVKSVVVMCCSGNASATHFHLLAVLDREGNQALAKLQLARLIPVVMKELG